MAKKNTAKKISIEEKLKALHQLQLIDTDIDNIRIVRGELPLEIEDLESIIEGLNSRLDKFNEELQVLKDQINSSKNTVDLANEAIKKYETQLKNIKNNREYTSLTKEIEYQNLEIQLAEKNKIQSEANILHKQEILNACQQEIDEKVEELKIKQKELDTIVKETEKEEKALLKRSEKAEKIIDERLLGAYKRIRSKVVNGLAVVSVERDACGGCFSKIPPQRQLDIQLHKKIITCEHCGRIMVDSNMLNAK
tara:strand:- start:1173 stop:1928 length:756 start_codon:yes stop_codon:yes gene_type:complete